MSMISEKARSQRPCAVLTLFTPASLQSIELVSDRQGQISHDILSPLSDLHRKALNSIGYHILSLYGYIRIIPLRIDCNLSFADCK